jgi:hypothetical protein
LRFYILARSFIGDLDNLDVMDTEVGGEEEEGSSNDKGSQTKPGMSSSEKEIKDSQTETNSKLQPIWDEGRGAEVSGEEIYFK